MLILRRRIGEAIVVAGEIEIEVIEITRTRVKLGVRAPGRISVARKEALPVAHENRLAASLISAEGTDVVKELLEVLYAGSESFVSPNTAPSPLAPHRGENSSHDLQTQDLRSR